MTKIPLVLIGIGLMAAPAPAASRISVAGQYVEARTAEVFTGGCTMNSEAETVGRQAVLAWKVARGHVDRIALDGLSVVAALAGDRNLGMQEMGGEQPTRVRAMVYVDERANAEQRLGLIALVREATRQLPTEIASVAAVPIRFDRAGDSIQVQAGDASLDVFTHVHHDPSCGAMQWFHPLGELDHSALGMTRSQVYWGTALGSRWRQVDKKSAFWGTFSLETATEPASHP